MTVTFSPACGPNPVVILPGGPITGWDSCYVNFAISRGYCTMTLENVYAPCHCDASDNCSEMPTGDTALPGQNLLCNGQPMSFTYNRHVTVSGSCTYQKAVFTATNASARILLTKINMLIAASLMLCAVIASF